MPKGKGKLIVVCQSGGKFTTASDGSLSYAGGDAHAITVDHQSKFNTLRSEMAEMWKYDPKSLTIKYFLPNNNRTLITISSDKDVKRMLDFHEDSAMVDVFVMKNESPPADISLLPASSSSKTTAVEVEPATPVEVPYLPYVGEDAATPVGGQIEDVEQNKLLKSWGNSITGLHQQFNNVLELREALRKYSMARGFACKYKHNDATRVTAKCKVEGCPWRIHASKISTTPLFRIKTFNEKHTCGAGQFSPQASRKLVVSILKEKMYSSPNFKPKEVANQIREEFGIELKYSQVWRGLEVARQQVQGSFKEAYNQLPGLREKIVDANPGSVVTLGTREDRSFHRLFIAFHASIYGFQNGCRPLLFLDTITLNSKYQSDLLTATALDGNDGIFPVAFAIVDNVDDDNWYWFLSQLKSALSSFQPITFVADRRMGLRESISMVFENSYHSYCLDNLSEELEKNMNGPDIHEIAGVIIDKFYEAATVLSLDGFRKCIDNIRSISPDAYNWIMASEPEHWASALFEGSRYKYTSSGIAKTFYNCVTELPTIVQVVDTIRCKMMELMYNRKVDSNQWLTRLTPSVEDKLQKETLTSELLQVPMSTTNTFEVHCFGAINVVNIDTWECSCREWQLNGYPCCHALAVLQRIERSFYDYCSKYFAAETYRLAYSESINPVPSLDKSVDGDSLSIQVHPPPVRRITAPPKDRRIRKKGVLKRPLHCSKCKGTGHNRATCNASEI